MRRTLEIRTSPHLLSGYSVDTIMFNVILALVPACVFAGIAFGWTGILTLATAVVSCLVTERLLTRGRSTLGDGSVTITGILYGLTLPPGLPLWMVVVGALVGVGVGKVLFGGLGSNAFNPALVGRAFLQAAFPVSMTTWLPAFSPNRFAGVAGSTLTLPFTRPVYDGMSGATPLSLWKFDHEPTAVTDLFLGMTSGSVGETSAVMILVGGLYLIARNMMNWRIPAAMVGMVALLSGVLHLMDSSVYPSPGFMVFSGGLMLGALFMATDMVGSPMTALGCWIYGGLIGLLVVVIRIWGGMPEGVMYAILLGNASTPLIDQAIRPRVFGVVRGAAS